MTGRGFFHFLCFQSCPKYPSHCLWSLGRRMKGHHAPGARGDGSFTPHFSTQHQCSCFGLFDPQVWIQQEAVVRQNGVVIYWRFYFVELLPFRYDYPCSERTTLVLLLGPPNLSSRCLDWHFPIPEGQYLFLWVLTVLLLGRTLILFFRLVTFHAFSAVPLFEMQLSG